MIAPAYLPVIAQMWRDGIIPPGRITHLEIAHDPGCAFFADGVCNCSPQVLLTAGSEDPRPRRAA